MGTRADFYIGRGEAAEWLGSIAWDGHPGSIPDTLRCAVSEEIFRRELARFAATREDWTAPSQGWPWPWDDSQTTDYAYVFDGGSVYASSFGGAWFNPIEDEPDDDDLKAATFPNMKARKNVQMSGQRSVLVVIRATPSGRIKVE